MSNGNRLLWCRLSFLATLVLAMVSAQHVSGQQPQRPDFVASLSAVDVATLVTRAAAERNHLRSRLSSFKTTPAPE